MRDELVDLLEGAGIEEQIDSLPRGQLAGLVLPAQALFAAAQLRAALEVFEIGRSARHLASTNSLLGLRNSLSLLPVLQEPLEPDVGERMLEHALDHRSGTGADVRPHPCRFDDVDVVPDRGDEDLVVNW